MANFRERSRQEWNADTTIEHINAGSLQRIADAVETVAKNYTALQQERDRYKKWYEDERESRKQSERSMNTLKGHVTRLQNRVRELESAKQEVSG